MLESMVVSDLLGNALRARKGARPAPTGHAPPLGAPLRARSSRQALLRGRCGSGGSFEPMEVSLEEKTKRVALWLEKQCGHRPFPYHQINGEIIDAFYQLATYSEDVDKHFDLLIEDMKQSATKYEEKANYLQDILTKRLGISLSSLSSESLSNIEVLVNSAMTLDTKDTSLTSFFSAISDMTSKLYKTELKNREMEMALRKMKGKIAAAVIRENQLDEDLNKSRKQVEWYKVKVEKETKTSDFLKKKVVEMSIRIKAAKRLVATELDKSVTHETLVNLSENLAEEQKRLENLNSKLESYLDLPPSILLAQVKVEEAKRELNAVEEEMTEEVNKIFFKEI
ncbi:HAUS augmin-like complex subunit 1 isoform X2 [Pogoniulus pusillus]|uniref:HAUS augmin-like complex subunit 1 isoform X2 n=1 Tax=Pogoniulus pusillus TaxID=488313 RepID=UPI0030B967E5